MLSFGAVMGAGLTSAVNINPELQRRSHHPFMSSGNWLNNSSFPFYKADKIHRGHCHRHGLRHSFPTGFCPAQLPAGHCLGSQVSTAAAQLERKGGGSAKELRKKQRKKTKGRRALLALCASQHTLPTQSRDHLLAPVPALGLEGPSLPYERFWSGVQLGNVIYLIISQQTPLSEKLGVSLTPTAELSIYFPDDYTYFPLQIQIK